MIITTIQDANAANCCPCDWPECAAPRSECGSRNAQSSYIGYNFDDDYESDPAPDPDTLYTSVYNYFAGGAVWKNTYTDQIQGWINGVKFIGSNDSDLEIIVEVFATGDFTVSYEGGQTIAAARELAAAVVLAELESSEYASSDCATLGSSRVDRNNFPRDAQTNYIQSRYRFGVPSDYSTLELPRTTWEMTWDEVFASAAWWSWYDGGMEGAAPDASVALVAARDWTWAGDMESPWTDWYEIPIPETPGETRVVNVMVICWRSTRLGYKPTYHGDQVALPE